MSLVINTNIASLTATRALQGTDEEMKTAMERLATGSKINSSADDAAGLAIGQLVQRRRDTVTAAGMVIALVVGGMLGSYRVETVDTVDVAVVQGGGPQNTRADVCSTRAVFERHMAASETIDREVDLVIDYATASARQLQRVAQPGADGAQQPLSLIHI